MSKLSSWLEKRGVPKSVQSAATSVARSVPGVGSLISVAQSAASAASPFTGVVRPGGSAYINKTFGLEDVGGDVDSGSSSTAGGHRGRIAAGPNGACPKGWHLNKHKLADGTPAHSVCVRNRHMNPMNGRAVARAARRIKRGEKLLRKIFSVEGQHHGKIKPKTHRKR